MLLLGLVVTVIRFAAVLLTSSPLQHHLPAAAAPAAAAHQSSAGDCLDAHRACGEDPRCKALYRGVELCVADAAVAPLGEQTASECLESQDALLARHPALLACRCHRGSRREEHCLHVYWSIRLLPASSSLPQDGLNHCLKAAQDCGLYEKCGALRSEYVLACTKRAVGMDRCNRHKCHRALRRFLERVPEEFSMGVLFCPCSDPLCGERRRKTIVPSCSYRERDGPQPNCLHLQSFCRRDDLCRSRLADFLHNCQSSVMSSSGCLRDTAAGFCLRAYAGLIGTIMTPNYISNSSADVSLWCNCEGSGNQWQDCLRLQRMFTHNPCLTTTWCLNTTVLGSEEDEEELQKKAEEDRGEGGQFDVIPLYSERATVSSLGSGPRGAATTSTTTTGPPPSLWLLPLFLALHLSWGSTEA
ncbi:hypothetical protein CRUP_035641 [Coryphaenoides rupestris]|nr:hypothetical protein CRUP_035641 [Coryphaenoides rupestris]